MATNKDTLEKWMAFTIKDLHASLAANDIGVTGALDQSIYGKVNQADKNGARMTISYLWYGKMRDMGVRRGMTLQDAMAGRSKGWWSSVIGRRMMALQEIMVNKYGAEAVAAIQDGIPGKIEFKM